MLLIFIATFVIITSTSIVHGPFAVNAASTKHQQKQHKSTITIFDSADKHSNVPERSTLSGITGPGSQTQPTLLHCNVCNN